MKIGVIGAGRIARSEYFPMLSGMTDVQVCVMCAHADKARQVCAEYGFSATAATLEELLDFAPDMVILLTPKQVRSLYLDVLLEKRIPVFCEKPLAMTLKECRHIVQLVQDTGTPLAVGFNRRYAAPVLDARAAFGRVCPELVVCEKYKENLDYRATLENAIHMIDLMRFVCGECDKVEAQARLATDAMHESLCTAQLSFENGSVGLLSTSRCAGAWAERIAMIGRDGNGNHVTAEIIMPLQLRIWRNGSLVEEKTYTAQDSGFIQGVEAFRASLNGQCIVHNTAMDAYKTELLVDQILKAAELPDLETEEA